MNFVAHTFDNLLVMSCCAMLASNPLLYGCLTSINVFNIQNAGIYV